MKYSDTQTGSYNIESLAKHKKRQYEDAPAASYQKPDVFKLADKHGLGDILGRELPEPSNMEEMNEQILAIEEVIKSMRDHIKSQYKKIVRSNLKMVL